MTGMGGKLSDSTCLQFWQFTKGKTAYAFSAFWNVQMMVFLHRVSFFFKQDFQFFNLFDVFGVEISDTETELTFALGSQTFAEKYSNYEPYYKVELSSCKKLLK